MSSPAIWPSQSLGNSRARLGFHFKLLNINATGEQGLAARAARMYGFETKSSYSLAVPMCHIKYTLGCYCPTTD
jgi:hypothetical protein